VIPADRVERTEAAPERRQPAPGRVVLEFLDPLAVDELPRRFDLTDGR
jgi:hypothetical protein